MKYVFSIPRQSRPVYSDSSRDQCFKIAETQESWQSWLRRLPGFVSDTLHNTEKMPSQSDKMGSRQTPHQVWEVLLVLLRYTHTLVMWKPM